MSKPAINIVWIKRDIRSQDHAPLYAADNADTPYLIIYLFEPEMIAYKDTSLRHLQFQYHALQDLNNKLALHNKKVEVLYGNAIDIFRSLLESFQVKTIFSYQESGTLITYHRDILLSELFKEPNCTWKEFQRDGVIRAIKNRDGWDEKWREVMEAPLIVNSYQNNKSVNFENNFLLPERLKNAISKYSSLMQPAGEKFAYQYLNSFVRERGANYSRHISKPLESRISCGRLSPYISWGNLSIRQIYQYVKSYKNKHTNTFALNNFLTRLHWHCHFIQKFESECMFELVCVNKVYEDLITNKNLEYIKRWENATTGYPLVDACMICLKETGWINFRMRAMLVSFFCHHLMQDWRNGVYFLAKQFLDYEPGIHFPQFQMQAGTTGVNTIRIYNPLKQSMEHDPEGVFIKKWLPQLKDVPTEFIHEPHKMDLGNQEKYHLILGVDYPFPVVDISETGKIARDVYWGIKKSPATKNENKKILAKHVRS
jgi:deoxyribodipyrimidine photo-lyase